PAGAAARTTHGDEKALFLFLVQIGTVEQFAGLLRKQVMQRQIAVFNPAVCGEGRGVAAFFHRRTTLTMLPKSPRRKQPMLCSIAGNARSAYTSQKPPRCGVMMTFLVVHSGWSAGNGSS